MSDDERKQKTEELKRLLDQVPKANSFESAALAQRISVLAREVFVKPQPPSGTVPAQ